MNIILRVLVGTALVLATVYLVINAVADVVGYFTNRGGEEEQSSHEAGTIQ